MNRLIVVAPQSAQSAGAGRWVAPIVLSVSVHAAMAGGYYAWSHRVTPPVAPAHFVVELVTVQDVSGARVAQNPAKATPVARPQAAMAPSRMASKKERHAPAIHPGKKSGKPAARMVEPKKPEPKKPEPAQIVPATSELKKAEASVAPLPADSAPPVAAQKVPVSKAGNLKKRPKPITRPSLVTRPKPIVEKPSAQLARLTPAPKRKPRRAGQPAVKRSQEKSPVRAQTETTTESTEPAELPHGAQTATEQLAKLTDRDSDDAASVASVASDGEATARLVPPRYAAPGRGNPLPSYPRSARRRSLEGRLMLRVVINPKGRVDTVEISKSSGHAILDHAAETAVRRWKFEPGRRAGIAVRAAIDIPVVFRLKQ